MGVRVLPAWVAAIAAVGLALVLFVPYVAVRYRRRGDLGAGDVALAFGFLLYALALIAYVMVPMPPVGPDFCQYYGWVRPQWQPMHVLTEWPAVRTWRDLPRVAADGSFRSFALNVAFFVPLGMFLRHLFRRGFVATVLIGFGVSLLVELTQLTGIWWIYPCPFRIFDVDDLISNTGGTAIGVLFAPLLRLVPGQRAVADAGLPRPVTRWRRLLAMMCDLLLVWWAGQVFALLAGVFGFAGPWVPAWAEWWVPAVGLLVLTVAARGASPGQVIVRLRPVAAGDEVARAEPAAGRRPGAVAMLLRWLVGLGGVAGLLGLAVTPTEVPGAEIAWWVALGLLLVHGVSAVFGRDQRGISGRLSGLQVIDARVSAAVPDPADDRRPTSDRQDG
ncbi:VanZ family protein [Crossiella cryophila]|uniref:Glycopeptide antibiotics resistance protein n=1 Tax=Crossiella cryophila TaxID=43355 RepID=A0A7W7CM65_9PSEU|nr:VanZ family protein [Crossiella cryophila]MBB4681964.1 glycopeptide antibiotics resistance protein [Crossiella cryophila]